MWSCHSWIWMKEDLVDKLLIVFQLIVPETPRPDPPPASVSAHLWAYLVPHERPSGALGLYM